MRAMCRVLSAQLSGTRAGVEFLRGSSGTLHGLRLQRLWNLLLLLPGAGRDYGLPHKSKRKSICGSARRRTCGSSVKETWQW